MKKRILALLLVVLLLVPTMAGCAKDDLKAANAALEEKEAALAEQAAKIEEQAAKIEELEGAPFDPQEFLDWYKESFAFMSIEDDNGQYETGFFKPGIENAPTDAELTEILDFACLAPNAHHWTDYYFIVVRDVDEQKGIFGNNAYVDSDKTISDGTISIIVLADSIFRETTQGVGGMMWYENGEVIPKKDSYGESDPMYIWHPYAYLNTGLACGLLNVAAAAKGYGVHYYATVTGDNMLLQERGEGMIEYPDQAGVEAGIGAAMAGQPITFGMPLVNANHYVREDMKRAWSLYDAYGTKMEDASMTYDVLHNCVFVCALIMGTADGDSSNVETWATYKMRPQNYAFFDPME